MKGTNIGDELNAAGLSWGWFEGGFRPSTSYQEALAATGKTGQPTSTFEPDEFSSYFSNAANRPGALEQPEPLQRGAPRRRRARRHRPVGLQGRLHPPPRAVRVLRLDGQPAPPDGRRARAARTRSPACESIGKDTQSYVGGVPQFNTPNHNYDTSDFSQLVEAINRRELPAAALPAVSFLKAPGYQDGHAAYSEPGRRAAVHRQRRSTR